MKKILSFLSSFLFLGTVVFAAGTKAQTYAITQSSLDMIKADLQQAKFNNVDSILSQLESIQGQVFHSKFAMSSQVQNLLPDVEENLVNLVIYRSQANISFPRPVSSYIGEKELGIGQLLKSRMSVDPFNLIASLIFLCAILHTFFAGRITAKANHYHHEYEHSVEERQPKESKRVLSVIYHFLGEVEAVFGIWAAVLAIVFSYFKGMTAMKQYFVNVNYTEPMFVVIIMTLASTRPVIQLAELLMSKVANLLGGTLTAWWLTILTLGPILGSFITEPAAMTISALLLANKFYSLKPSNTLAYATLGLLFVNISVGGTLSHFAAPPVLMVAAPWNWDFMFMLTHFGWKATIGIFIATGLYWAFFKKEFAKLEEQYAGLLELKSLQDSELDIVKIQTETEHAVETFRKELGFLEKATAQFNQVRAKLKQHFASGFQKSPKLEGVFDQIFDKTCQREIEKSMPALIEPKKRPAYRDPLWDQREDPTPLWVMIIHVLFMVWTVFYTHYPPMFIGGFLFFLGFARISETFQNRVDLKPALLVGFFLAGLVIHGGLQAWWIQPVLGSLSEVPLMLGATVLTAFNDNAAITYLSTLVPGFTDSLKYAVVAGAVTGGGLTVIANAPNPAGQSILSKFFKGGISPANLAISALIPTIIMGLAFMLLPH